MRTSRQRRKRQCKRFFGHNRRCHSFAEKSNSISPRGIQNGVPLSFAQQRLWFLAQFERGSQAYHIAGGLRLRGDLDQQTLRRALAQIVARHEAFRTTFSQVNGHPIQVIGSPENGFHLEEEDLRQAADAADELRRLAEREATAPFDLERGPLIRGRQTTGFAGGV
jgi:hypothetical protein